MTLWSRSRQLKPEASTFPFTRMEFDAQAYLAENPDIAGMDPWAHFVRYGYSEGRQFTSISDRIEKYVRIIESGYFDPSWYTETYPDVGRDKLLALKHFCDIGVWEERDPGPGFSTSWYLQQYPDIRGMNPLLHYIDYGIREGRSSRPPRGALDSLQRGYSSIYDLDPDLGSNTKFMQWKSVPIVDGRTRSPIKNVVRNVLRDFNATNKRLVLVPWCIHSGSDVVVANILHAADELYGPDSTAVVIVDHDRDEGLDWLPKSQNVINFAAHARELSWDDKQLALEKTLVAVSPDACLNVNSRLAWDLYKNRGAPLSAYTRLYACIFCPDYNEFGTPAGYAHTHLRDSFPYLDGIISDNETFPRILSADLGLLPQDSSKFSVLPQPVRHVAATNRRSSSVHNRGLNILWASRLCRQKNYTLLSEIIRRSPSHFKFNVYGSGDERSVTDFERLVQGQHNVTIHGSYRGIVSLPLETFDAYLYTSLWDGVPNTILECATYGIPIVASRVGGIGELITDENGWLIDDFENPNDYVSALKQVFQDKKSALSKAKRLQDDVSSTHSWHSFCKKISEKNAFLGSLNDC